MASVYPSLAGAYRSLSFSKVTADVLDGLDVVFLALPHGESQRLVPALVGRVGLLVDLAADFRLLDPAAYEVWYGAEHEAPGLLGRFAYGLPELAFPYLRWNHRHLWDTSLFAAGVTGAGTGSLRSSD